MTSLGNRAETRLTGPNICPNHRLGWVGFDLFVFFSTRFIFLFFFFLWNFKKTDACINSLRSDFENSCRFSSTDGFPLGRCRRMSFVAVTWHWNAEMIVVKTEQFSFWSHAKKFLVPLVVVYLFPCPLGQQRWIIIEENGMDFACIFSSVNELALKSPGRAAPAPSGTRSFHLIRSWAGWRRWGRGVRFPFPNLEGNEEVMF